MKEQDLNLKTFKAWRNRNKRRIILFFGSGVRYLNHRPFFLNKSQVKKLNKLRSKNIEDYKTWSVYSILLPISAYLFAFLVNVLFLVNQPCSFTTKEVFQTLNNGSLPIIAFGIVSSCISYLMELIEESSEQKTIWYLRRKLMAVAVLFLFLTSAIYILQSINRKFIYISPTEEVIIFLTTLLVLYFAVSTGRKMFLLQRNTVQEDLADEIRRKKTTLATGLTSQFGNDEN